MLTTIIQWLTIYILVMSIVYSLIPLKEGLECSVPPLYKDINADNKKYKNTYQIDSVLKSPNHFNIKLPPAVECKSKYSTVVKYEETYPDFASVNVYVREKSNMNNMTILPDIGTYDCLEESKGQIIKESTSSLAKCADDCKNDTNCKAFRYSNKNLSQSGKKNCILLKDYHTGYDQSISTNTILSSNPLPSKIVQKCKGLTLNSSLLSSDAAGLKNYKCLSDKCYDLCQNDPECKANAISIYKLTDANKEKNAKVKDYKCINIKSNIFTNNNNDIETNNCKNKIYAIGNNESESAIWRKNGGYIYYPKLKQGNDTIPCFSKTKTDICKKPCYTLTNNQFLKCKIDYNSIAATQDDKKTV